MTWPEQFAAALLECPAGAGVCDGCAIEPAPRVRHTLGALCVVCWIRKSIVVDRNERPLKRNHAAHGSRPGKGLPADIPALRGKK